MNDLVVKGRVVTLNLVRMVLRFSIGKVAVQGDLKQFYASIKLVESQWNLQHVLFRENLDPKAEVLEGVIKTLIWGVKSVSAQSECAIMKLAQYVTKEKPELADFLTNSRFVPVLKHLLRSQINERNCMILREQLNNIISELAITRASVVGTRQIC